jgi:flagellar basal-body rod modification protein FlgD
MITGVNSTGSSSSNALSTATQQLDKDAFLKLLITQMQSQDPLQPMEDKEFIAQLAQFSALEQTQQTNTNLGTMMQMVAGGQALDLVGKTIQAQSSDGTVVSGKVDGVKFDSKQAWLTVGDTLVDPADVFAVSP